ncbi:phospholipase D-like domain-containing protein [Zarconia navalis]|uniref:phospholipase D-like domain-containing protein n=1 Tax=Zarconia navalis TaxID=2992134 RepID=UPI0021F86A4F|nr:phospholipase D-like domain-containing protein [Zarconia navalis]
MSRGKFGIVLVVLLLLGTAIAAFWWQGDPKPNETPKQPPLPQEPFVRAYFNHNRAAEYTEPYRGQTRAGDDLERSIVSAIERATTRVDVAVQELRLPDIARALVERHQKGVEVRVILENTYNRPWSDYTDAELNAMEDRDRQRLREGRRFIDINGDGSLSSEEIRQRDALLILQDGGVPLLDDTADGSKGSGLMHHKFVIADDRILIVTSANFTPSGIHGDPGKPASRGNANNLLELESSQLARVFTEEFNLMWGDGPSGRPDSRFGLQKPVRSTRNVTLGDTSVSVQFSPTSRSRPWEESVNGTIAQVLSGAATSVDLALFVFSEQALVDVIGDRHRGGVAVRSLIDPSFAFREYSEGLDMLGVALPNAECEYEAGNRPWKNAIDSVGVPLLPPGDKLHHKFALIDDRITIAGSHNWSAAANTQNDETVLIVRSPIVAAHFRREFDRLYTDATLGIPGSLQNAVRERQIECPPPPTNIQAPVRAKVNVNTATARELETLPGIGPTLAQNIIATRSQQRFASLEDLDRVSGIGPAKLEQLRGRVTW